MIKIKIWWVYHVENPFKLHPLITRSREVRPLNAEDGSDVKNESDHEKKTIVKITTLEWLSE